MDTNRISIISRDLSEGVVTNTATLKGYTVVRAPKGPISPILIPAGNPGLIYETLGYTSDEYPEIQEVLDFNRLFDVYVAAPYKRGVGEAKVPVAYITPAGVFPAASTVDIGESKLEDIQNDEAMVVGINSFGEGDIDVLIPAGKEASLFATEDTLLTTDASEVLEYENNKLKINLGFKLKDAFDAEDSKLEFLHGEGGDDYTLEPPAGNVAGTLVFDIPGESNLIELDFIEDGSSGIFVLVESGQDSSNQVNVALAGGKSFFEIDGASGEFIGSVYKKYFSKSAILGVWQDEDFRNSVKVYWKAKLHENKIKATIYPKYLSERTINLNFPAQKFGNEINLMVSEKITPTVYSSKKIKGSLIEDAKDGFGNAIGFSDALIDQNLIEVYIINEFEEDDIYVATGGREKPSMPAIDFRLSRGKREVDLGVIEEAWEAAGDPDFEHVEIFFKPDVVRTGGEDSNFFLLADKHKLSRFVASVEISPENVENTPALGFGKNYYIVTNEFRRRSTFTKEDYWSPLIGHVASMYLRCVNDAFGGVAPMYLNSGGLGGQLNVSVKKAKHKFNKDKQTLLDAKNYNLIVKDQSFGVMIVGQKTAKEGELSDWSYIGHSSAFLKVMRDIRDNVMIPQLGKPNNDYYRELRKDQIDSILKPRIEGLTKIWSQAVSDTSTAVNTVDVLKERKFAMVVKVKVDIFSEGVELTLINYDQGTDIV